VPEFIDLAFAPNYISYADAYQKQLEIHAEVVSGKRPNTVLLLEHSSVYTAGKRTEAAELPMDGSEFVETNRGGKITWHGPGQLVGYPIMKLPQPIDVVNYVRWMEQVLIDVIERLGAKCQRVEGRTGVWFETEQGFEKVAAIGIRCREGDDAWLCAELQQLTRTLREHHRLRHFRRPNHDPQPNRRSQHNGPRSS